MPADREDPQPEFTDVPGLRPGIYMREVLRDHADPLNERDHLNMEAFIDAALQDHKDGVITKDRARQAIAHVMTALAVGNLGEARDCSSKAASSSTGAADAMSEPITLSQALEAVRHESAQINLLGNRVSGGRMTRTPSFWSAPTLQPAAAARSDPSLSGEAR